MLSPYPEATTHPNQLKINWGMGCFYWVSELVWFFLDRFKSIAKSYFRRADGVLLLYDVTCEKSFLNVREWVDTIEVCLTLYRLKE